MVSSRCLFCYEQERGFLARDIVPLACRPATVATDVQNVQAEGVTSRVISTLLLTAGDIRSVVRTVVFSAEPGREEQVFGLEERVNLSLRS